MMRKKKRSLMAATVLMTAATVVGLGGHLRASALPIGSALPADIVIHLTAKKFTFSPDTITLRKGEPVVLQISSADREHGFKLRAFGVRTDVNPGRVSILRFIPDKTGRFTFSCDVFCGEGHEEMTGTVVVTD